MDKERRSTVSREARPPDTPERRGSPERRTTECRNSRKRGSWDRSRPCTPGRRSRWTSGPPAREIGDPG